MRYIDSSKIGKNGVVFGITDVCKRCGGDTSVPLYLLCSREPLPMPDLSTEAVMTERGPAEIVRTEACIMCKMRMNNRFCFKEGESK